jgi:Domain of unknown function (DUF1883)
MGFVHRREHLNGGDVVIVNCSHQANVMIMTDANFRRYQSGERADGYGGRYRRFPAQIAAPSTGYWNITIDLGGSDAQFRYRINVLRRKH